MIGEGQKTTCRATPQIGGKAGKQKERSQEAPEIAENRAEIAQLELGPCKSSRHMKEMSPLGRKTTWEHCDRLHDQGRPLGDGAAISPDSCAGFSPSRSRATVCGRSTIPPVYVSPRTTIVAASSCQSAKRCES